MKRILAAALAMVLVSTAALAGWNLRQNDDGSADWLYTDGSTSWRIGRLERSVSLSTISTAATEFMVSPISGYITGLWIAVDRAITANTSFVLTAQSGAASSTRRIVSSAFTVSAPTVANSISWAVSYFVPASNFSVAKDTVITINTQGTAAPAATSNARVLVQIDPYP